MPAVIVDSSWIDIEAGLAKSSICRTPPDFCARTGPVMHDPASKAPAAATRRRLRLIAPLPVLTLNSLQYSSLRGAEQRSNPGGIINRREIASLALAMTS